MVRSQVYFYTKSEVLYCSNDFRAKYTIWTKLKDYFTWCWDIHSLMYSPIVKMFISWREAPTSKDRLVTGATPVQVQNTKLSITCLIFELEPRNFTW